jgi:hypothetical protein
MFAISTLRILMGMEFITRKITARCIPILYRKILIPPRVTGKGMRVIVRAILIVTKTAMGPMQLFSRSISGEGNLLTPALKNCNVLVISTVIKIVTDQTLYSLRLTLAGVNSLIPALHVPRLTGAVIKYF